MNRPLDIVVVEDEQGTRDRLCASIEAEAAFCLAAVFTHAQAAIDWLQTHAPDVLLCDLGLPDGSGLDVIRQCAARHPGCNIMVITMFGDEQNLIASIEAGATGYLMKEADTQDIAREIQVLRDGGSPMNPLTARKLLNSVLRPGGAAAAVPADPVIVSPLTPREKDTLELIARGYTYEEVGRLLSLSVSTVQTHIRGIYGKLAVNSRSEAVFEARRMGILKS